MSTNGMYGSADTRDPADEVQDEIDVYNRVTRPAAGSEEFVDTNFGLGNYGSEAEMYRQVQSFREGMFGRAAFARAIHARALDEAREGFLREKHRLKAPTDDFVDWRDRNEDLWEDLDRDEKNEQIRKHANVEPFWKPPQLKTAEMRLEVSRGRDARLLDNVFGRVVEKITQGTEAAKEALAELGGKNS